MAITVPYRFEDCPMEHLVSMVADMLDRLLRHNDLIPLHPDALTRFHSRTAPSISVLDYLRRVVRYTNLERSCLLITLHYIDQMCSRLPRFTISSLTVHRFLIASVCVSTKALCDSFCTNSHYAKIGGIRLAELNVLEREFLSALEWRLICSGELLQEYYVNLARSHSSNAFEVADQPPAATVSTSLTPDEDVTGTGEVEDEPSSSSAGSSSSLSSSSSSPGESSAVNVADESITSGRPSEGPSSTGEELSAEDALMGGTAVASGSGSNKPIPGHSPVTTPALHDRTGSLSISTTLSPLARSSITQGEDVRMITSAPLSTSRPASAHSASPTGSGSLSPATPRKRPRQGSISSPLQMDNSHPSPRRRRVKPPLPVEKPAETVL